VRHWRLKDELESDERTKKLGHTASHTHGCSPSFFLAVLFWVNYLGLLTLPVGGVLLVTILLMALSAPVFPVVPLPAGDVA